MLGCFHIPSILALLQRYAMEYGQVWRVLIVRDVADRLLFFTAFGYGMGHAIKLMGDVPYLTFLTPGIAAGSGVYVMTFAMTFGAFERYKNYQLWQSWLATPIDVPDILISELFYAAVRALPPLFILYGLAYSLGHLPSVWGAFISLPIIFLANLCFGAVALVFTSFVSRSMYFGYVMTLWTTPMYLFSGTFFDLSQAPVAMQWFAKVYPLSYLLDLVRPLMLGQSVAWQDVVVNVGILAGLAVVAFSVALYRFRRKLFD